MAPFFDRFSSRSRSGTTSTQPASSKGSSAVPSPDWSTRSTSPSQISTTPSLQDVAQPPSQTPRLVLTEADSQDDPSLSLSSPSDSSPSTPVPGSGHTSLRQKPPIATPAHNSPSLGDSDSSDVRTPTAGNGVLTHLPLRPPEVVIQPNSPVIQPVQLAAHDLPSRRSSLASLTLRKKESTTAMKNGQSAPRSRRGSAASSTASAHASAHRQDTISTVTQITVVDSTLETAFTGGIDPSTVPLARAPSLQPSSTQLLTAPTFDSDNISIRSGRSSAKKGRLWPSSKKNANPAAGGIAGALAQSGLSLTGMSSPPIAQPSSPPRTVVQQPSRTSPRHFARTSIDSVLHPRRGSLSAQWHSDEQEHFPEDSDDLYDSPDALSFDDEEMPVTGFAVASSKRNMEFHELFHDIDEGDYLIEDYVCAMQRDILVQGRLYISENHMCFHANIFGWVTNVTIPFSDVVGLEKKMTAFVIPNAIGINTHNGKFTFASFISRDTSFEVIYNIWRLSHPRDGATDSIDGHTPGGGSSLGGTSDVVATGAGGAITGPAAGLKKSPTQCACGKKGEHYETVMMDCLMPGTPGQIHTLMWTSAFIRDFMVNNQKLLDIQTSDWAPQTKGSHLLSRTLSYTKPLNNSLGPKSTRCEIVDETVYADFEDYVSIVTTTRTPNVPSGGAFSVKTRTCLMWAGPAATKIVVTSSIVWTGRSYIKSMIERGAQDGQRTWHADLEVAMRAYINAHRIEFFPDGEGDVPLDLRPELPTPIASTDAPEMPLTREDIKKAKQREMEQKSLQWALDTITGAWNVATKSTKGALDLISEMFAESSTTGLLIVVVVALVISNVWTLMTLKSAQRKQAEQRFQMRMNGIGRWPQPQPSPAADAEALRVLLENVLAGGGVIAGPTASMPEPTAINVLQAPEEELRSIAEAISSLEARLGLLKSQVSEAVSLD